MTTAQEVEETRAMVEAARLIGGGIPWLGFVRAVRFYIDYHHITPPDAPAKEVANVAKSE